MEARKKWKCEECGEITYEPLRALSPFDPDDELIGCPNCKSVNTLVGACQIAECTLAASSGNTNCYGFRYVWTCWGHSPANPLNRDLGISYVVEAKE